MNQDTNKKQVDQLTYLIESTITNIRFMGKEQTFAALNQYINTGNANGYTRSGGARNLLLQVPHTEVLYLLNGKSLEAFFAWIGTEEKYREEEKNKRKIGIDTSIVNSIISAIETTYLKYIQNNPQEIVRNAFIGKFDEIAHHQYSSITRDDNARNNLAEAISHISTERIYEVLRNFLHTWGYETNTEEQIAVALIDYVEQRVNQTLALSNNTKTM